MVFRCICCSQLFASALQTAREQGCRTVAELQKHLTIGAKCGLCIPFLQRVIETGETDIPLMSVAETAEWTLRAGVDDGVDDEVPDA